MNAKPLGQKAYGHIPHLPSSRMGPGDHHCAPGQADICTVKQRDKHDLIIVQEKLDGSCVSAAKLEDGSIVALGRAGWTASSSPYEQHQLWAHWVRLHEERFRALLQPGERVVGEWLAQVHGTRYALKHEPFVAFDIMRGTKRTLWNEVDTRAVLHGFKTPSTPYVGGAVKVEEVYKRVVEDNHHGALDEIEGIVYRVERKGAVDFLAKWVRPDKQDGCFLPDVTKAEAIWNWRP